MISISPHAIHNFIERVAACSRDEARASIMTHEKAIECAADFGCEIVKLGDGSRLVLDGTRVLTVYARHALPRQCRRGVLA